MRFFEIAENHFINLDKATEIIFNGNKVKIYLVDCESAVVQELKPHVCEQLKMIIRGSENG